MQCFLMDCCNLRGEMCASCGKHLDATTLRRWDGETFCHLDCAWEWATARRERRMILAETLVYVGAH